MSPLFQTVSLHRVLPMTYVGKSIIFKTEKTTIPQTQIEEIIATYQPKTQADSILLYISIVIRTREKTDIPHEPY
ncbi:MAG TPA: hypothetical protein ENI27_06345 [bacterium]|nr:hypothetical protein [bacterium]